MGHGSLDRFVNDANLLVEVGRIASSLEGDDSVSEGVDNVLEGLDVAVAESKSANVETLERSDPVDDVSIFWSDMRDSDDANGEEDLQEQVVRDGI
jgi:hypothetical protein